MIKYLIDSIRRKIARRVTKTYPTRIDQFNIPDIGPVRFANWENPLVEPKEISARNIAFLRKFLAEGDVGIDIGANIGLMSVTMALVVGKKGLILAFDPNPYVFDVLLENTRLNPGLTNIRAYNFAISEVDGEFYYTSSEASFNNGGISTEAENRHGHYSLETKIKGVNLENFLKKNYADAVSRIKLIKIDTEGYDKEIIKSISGFINTYKPAIITECFGKTDAEARYEHFELLKSKGYNLFYISDFDANAAMTPIEKKEDMTNWKHFDLFAVVE